MTEQTDNQFTVTPLKEEEVPTASLASSAPNEVARTRTGHRTGGGQGRGPGHRGSNKLRRWPKPAVRQIRVLKPEKNKPAGPIQEKQGGLKIIHLGGLGEVGRNMSAVQYDDEIILIDCGTSFPGEDLPGIDFIIPNVGYLEDKKDMIRAIFFTHGHMDHIGAFPFLRDKLGDPDIYAAPLTKALLLKRQDDFKYQKPLEINEFNPGDEIKISDKITVKALRVNHSIPDDLFLIIKTPVGNVAHTSDFKFDSSPINDKPADIAEMKKLSEEGVLVLMSDSTGAEKEGHVLSESDVTENLEKLFNEATGMIIVGTFASLINRIQQLVTISEKMGRKIVFDGYSMKTNVEITKKLGYLKIKPGTQINMDDVDNYPHGKITAIVTGAQGEGNAALMRIANGEHRVVKTHKNDTYIFSSSVVPGNERNVQFLKDQLYRNGAKVFNYTMLDIHAGGHGSKEDLRDMINLIKPKFLLPVHGQYSMMVNHGLIGQEEGIPETSIIIADNGTVTHLEKDKWWFDPVRAPSDFVFVDGLGIGDVGNVVLRDRQILAEDGMFVIVALLDSKTGRVVGSPDIISRGFIYLKENKELLSQVRKRIKFIIENKTSQQPNLAYLKEAIRNQIGLFLFQKTERRPMVLPVLIEV
ncbi:MAG: RNA-metabolising metallo-beta-lactamase [Candidatus Yanofskybacteria bacterium GW2011_GWC2_41_9]|uniref:Ribonuclease J n=2 Tax=Parcubacteria group TaxID=1794811 RepID=A0A0G0ZT73_9BACT|nr:MAG: RNA-metabolising metallo-beta-lactamase [Candidatus Jorgensenbacteria bacterium GW2011_GWF2_41_8]KKS27795.1 MAG: RNA-metabolising metallo-beta-lactamase [Candidatus Yanofskybacteria bacterium GW2011_GWC2_41_9]